MRWLTYKDASVSEMCTFRRYQEIVEILYRHGGKELLFQEANMGRNCLHFAAASGRGRVSEYLLAIGGKDLLLARHQDGRLAIHYAGECMKHLFFFCKILLLPEHCSFVCTFDPHMSCPLLTCIVPLPFAQSSSRLLHVEWTREGPRAPARRLLSPLKH